MLIIIFEDDAIILNRQVIDLRRVFTCMVPKLIIIIICIGRLRVEVRQAQSNSLLCTRIL